MSALGFVQKLLVKLARATGRLPVDFVVVEDGDASSDSFDHPYRTPTGSHFQTKVLLLDGTDSGLTIEGWANDACEFRKFAHRRINHQVAKLGEINTICTLGGAA